MSGFKSLNNKSEEKYNAQENEDTKVETVPYNLGGKIRTYAILGTKNLTVPKTNMDMYLKSNNEIAWSMCGALSSKYYVYIRIKGKHEDDENYVMVINITLDYTFQLEDKFGQDSFFWANEDGISYYERKDENGEHHVIEKSGKIDNMQDAFDFISKHYDFQFPVYFEYLNNVVGEEYDEKQLVESVREDASEGSRYYSRCVTYKKSYEDIYEDIIEENILRKAQDTKGRGIIMSMYVSFRKNGVNICTFNCSGGIGQFISEEYRIDSYEWEEIDFQKIYENLKEKYYQRKKEIQDEIDKYNTMLDAKLSYDDAFAVCSDLQEEKNDLAELEEIYAKLTLLNEIFEKEDWDENNKKITNKTEWRYG